MSDYKLIPLSRGRFAKVSPEDFKALSAVRWYCQHGGGYAVRTKRNPGGTKAGQRVIYMHRVILKAPPGVTVDHINGDPLDNRRSNLRLATKRQNLLNGQRQRSDQANSRFRGVVYYGRGRRKPWTARVKVGDKKVPLGYWPSEEEAARAYDAAALHYYGEFASPNFPDSQPATVAELRALARNT